MADLDSLNIKLTGDTSDASAALKDLIEELGALKEAFGRVSTADFNTQITAASHAISSVQHVANSVNTNGLQKVAEWLRNIADASKGVDPGRFESLTTALEGLLGVRGEVSNLNDISAAIGLLGEGTSGAVDGIPRIVSALNSISQITFPEGIEIRLTEIADAFTKFDGIKPPNFEGFEEAGPQLTEFVRSLPNKADGERAGAWANALTLFTKLNLSSAFSEQLKATISAISGLGAITIPDMSGVDTLANNIAKLKTALQGLPNVASEALKSNSSLNRISISKELTASITRTAEALTAFSTIPAAIEGAKQVANGLADAGTKLEAGAAALEKLTPALEKLSQINIPEAIATQLMEIASALESLVSINPEKIGNIKNQMQGLSQTGKAVSNAASNMKKAGKAQNLGFADTFMGIADSMGIADQVAIRFGAQLGVVSSVTEFTTNMFKKLTGSVTSLTNIFKNSSKVTKGFSSTLQKLYYTLGTIRRVAYAVRAVFNTLKAPIDLASDLTEVRNVVLQAFGPQNYNVVENWSKSLVNSFGISSQAAMNAASRYGAMAVSMGMTQKQASDMAMTLVERAADLGSLYNKDFETVAKNMDSVFTGMVAPMRKYGVDLTQASLKEYAMAKGMDTNIKGMSQMQKALLRYQYVLEKTTIAQGDFARTSDTWANQIKILKTYLQALGSTIGQAFINMFKPVIRAANVAMNTIIGLVEKTVNAIGRLMGWRVEIAPTIADVEEMQEEMAGSADDTADGLGKANKNAKELKRTILGFDEIHALQKPDSGSDSGSGSGAGDGSALSDSADSLVKGGEMLLKRYESEIKDWFDLGQRMSDALSGALDNVNWERVYQRASMFGTNLASFLNGLITPSLFEKVGKSIANVLNTALHYLDSFGTTFNWKNFGRSIAAGINGFFASFDFGLLAHTISTWASGLLSMVIETLDNIDWKQIIDGLNRFIMGLDFVGEFGRLGASIRNALVTVLGRFDWKPVYALVEKFAKGLADFLNSLITPQLFSKVGKTLAGALNTTFRFLNTFWRDFDWEQFGISLADGINSFFSNFDFNQFSEYVRHWIGSLTKTIVAVLTHADLSEIAKTITILLTSNTIRMSFVNVSHVIKDWFTKIMVAVATPANWAKVFAAFKEFGRLCAEAVDLGMQSGDMLGSFKKSFGNLRSLIGGQTGAIIGTLGGLTVAFVNFFGMWSEGWSIAGEIFKDIGIVVAGAAAVIGGFITGPIALLVGGISIAASTIAVLMHDKIAGSAKEAFQQFVESTSGAGHTMDDFVSSMESSVDSATEKMDEMAERFKRLDSVRSEIGQTVEKIKSISTAIQVTGDATESEVNDLMTSFSNLQSSLDDYISAYYDAMIQQMIMDMNYLESQGKLTDSMKEEYLARITEAYKAKDAAIDSTKKIMDSVEKASKNYSDVVDQYGRDSQEAQDALSDYIEATGDAIEVTHKYTGETDALSPELDEVTDSLGKLAGGLDLSNQGIDDGKELTHKYTDTVRDMQTELDKGKQKIHEYYQGLRDNLDDTLMTQEQYDWQMEQYNIAEQTRVADIEQKYAELKSQLDNEVRPAFDQMNISMSDNLDEMDRNADSKLSKLFNTFGNWIRSIRDKWNELRGLEIDASVNTQTSVRSLPVQHFASGGIIEDGLFTMSHGEIAGRFVNGDSVVANNEQIQNGIRDAVVEGMMEVYMATSSGESQSGGDVVLVIDDEEIARATMRGQRKIDKRYHPVVGMA